MNETICAVATGRGGAISIIRISGEESLGIVDRIVDFRDSDASSSKGYTLKLGRIEGLDDVLVSIFRAPHSYTGEDGAEISCHASDIIVSGILERLVAAGARLARPGEFTQRAFINGKMDLSQAEAVADLISARSEAAHKLAMSQMKGAYSQKLKSLRDSLLNLSSLLELELDFSGEDVEFASRESLRTILDDTVGCVKTLCESFHRGNAIRNGIPVAIVGPVNSGKSTLLNALLGEDRSIVSDVEGTTRDTVEEVFNIGGLQYRLIDTAGIRKTGDKVEKMGIERTLRKLSEADIVLLVLDASATLEDDIKVCGTVVPKVGKDARLIVLRNKVDFFDRIDAHKFPQLDSFYHIFELKYPALGTYELDPDALTLAISRALSPEDQPEGACIPTVMDISALTGEGVDELRASLATFHSAASGTDAASASDGYLTLVSNVRHYEALCAALKDLEEVRAGLDAGLSGDLLAEPLRSAITNLNSIFGEGITSEDILGQIFGHFCIGK